MAEDDPRQTLEPSSLDTQTWITEILRSVGSMTIASYCFNPLAATLLPYMGIGMEALTDGLILCTVFRRHGSHGMQYVCRTQRSQRSVPVRNGAGIV